MGGVANKKKYLKGFLRSKVCFHKLFYFFYFVAEFLQRFEFL
jgi:hypothetical protein